MTHDARNASARPFKICTLCEYTWETRNEFLQDDTVILAGYQVNFERPEDGVLIFNHKIPECGTSLGLSPSLFKDMYEGPKYRERLHGTERCPGFCLHEELLGPCPEKCACAWVRGIVEIVARYGREGR